MAKLSSGDSALLLATEYICEEHGQATPQQLADDLEIPATTLNHRLSPKGPLRVDELVECIIENDVITAILITEFGLGANNSGGKYDTKEVRDLRAKLVEATDELERLRAERTEPVEDPDPQERPNLTVVPDTSDLAAEEDTDDDELDLVGVADELDQPEPDEDGPAIETAALTLVPDRDRATIIGTDRDELATFEREQAIRVRDARIEALEAEVMGLRGGTLDSNQRLREKLAAAEAARGPDKRRITELERNYQGKVDECIAHEQEKRNLEGEVRTLTADYTRLLATGTARRSA